MVHAGSNSQNACRTVNVALESVTLRNVSDGIWAVQDFELMAVGISSGIEIGDRIAVI
jgi:hypothetical protein